MYSHLRQIRKFQTAGTITPQFQGYDYINNDQAFENWRKTNASKLNGWIDNYGLDKELFLNAIKSGSNKFNGMDINGEFKDRKINPYKNVYDPNNHYEWNDFSNYLNNTSYSQTSSKGMPSNGYGSGMTVEQAKNYENFTNYVMNNMDDPNVKAYLWQIGQLSGQSLFDQQGNYIEGAADKFHGWRTDDYHGYYHETPNYYTSRKKNSYMDYIDQLPSDWKEKHPDWESYLNGVEEARHQDDWLSKRSEWNSKRPKDMPNIMGIKHVGSNQKPLTSVTTTLTSEDVFGNQKRKEYTVTRKLGGLLSYSNYLKF